MGEFIVSHLWEILFGLLSAGALAFCKYLWGRNKKLEEMQKADQTRQQRQMILDEIEPIIQELTTIHGEVAANQAATQQELAQMKLNAEHTHENMYSDLAKIQEGNERNFTLILNSYKFRLIQLCKTHLKDGYISEHDFEQITEMYKLYTGLGGNGQAQEYYDKVIALEIRS